MDIYMVDTDQSIRMRFFQFFVDCITFLRDWKVEK
jgi:hypothetical protein